MSKITLLFLRVVEVKSLVQTSEIDGAEPELEIQVNKKRLKALVLLALFFTFMWASQMGKTTWIVELLKHYVELCTHSPKN